MPTPLAARPATQRRPGPAGRRLLPRLSHPLPRCPRHLSDAVLQAAHIATVDRPIVLLDYGYQPLYGFRHERASVPLVNN